MKIINNQSTLLLDELKETTLSDSKIYISCNYFTSYALFDLLPVVKKAAKVKMLLDVKDEYFENFNFIQVDSEAVHNLKLDRKYRINQVLISLAQVVEIRKGNLGNQNMIIVDNSNSVTCYIITPQNLDSIALGTLNSNSPILINSFADGEGQYLNLFKQQWNHSQAIINDKISATLKKGANSLDGESIYKYTIRELFQYSTISERAEQKLQNIGFKDSKVWQLLFNFQKDAVIGAIEKIETYGGCIIADSVGLGKTFEALAVMKYYQLRNDRILVLAPKKLRENWTVYQLNDKRNILAADRLNYDVLNHTDLTRETGKSGDIDLEMINWGNYDLVVIDESHNFRNNPNRRDKVTRYARLMNDVIRSNIRTKVLMLSATPVNSKMNDLKNQIAFITEGDDSAFSSYGVDSVSQVMKDAQRKFTLWYRNGDPENLKVHELMKQLDGSYFRILDMLTIARSRKHIEKYYDTADIGKFPTRLTPKTVTPEIDTKNQFKDIGEIYDEISTLTLASYTPLAYVRSDKLEEYELKYDIETKKGTVFRQTDREQSLLYLMRINLLKRLESSIHSFKLTVEKLIGLIDSNLEQIGSHNQSSTDYDINITEVDIDDTDLEDLLVGGKTKVLLQDMDLIRWKQDLKQDRKVLLQLMESIELIDAARDAKLKKLREIILEKLAKPINEGNKKVIVFSAFADTAIYLYSKLSAWLKEEEGLYSALITGSATNKTNMPGVHSDLNSILTHFSPLSKNRKEIYPSETNEINVLFCTDCISEGQNLQDCDFLINYDIHWNPVRIIQRFGRIDRIGSVNQQIQLVNFFPSMELDSFIDLVARVQGRMVMLDVSATGEDNIIAKNSKEMQDLEYRKKQLKQLQNQVIDLEDVEGSISITDLTFNDFKIDLEKSTDFELEELNHIPPASYAVVASNLEQIKPGAIFCLKDISAGHHSKLKKNILHPYFLLYISQDGEQLLGSSNTKQTLDYYRKLCMGNDRILPELIAEFEKETNGYKNMEAYTNLIQKAITEVKGVKEEIGLDSLASAGGTDLFGESLGAEHSLELVSYLIIK